MANDPLLTASRALMQAVLDGEERDGGLITRETLRLASLLRIEIDRAERKAAETIAERRDRLGAIIREETGCGLSIASGEAVFCTDARLPDGLRALTCMCLAAGWRIAAPLEPAP